MLAYPPQFYKNIFDGSVSSARVVVPMVCALLRPQQVVDVGCGLGTWLSVFREAGVRDCLGVDSPSLDRAELAIPVEQFLPTDLTQPLTVGKTFDLALCLEVAEHLPETCADHLVASLVRLAPVVLFSAAIPFQGGHHHINEQWPEYWADRFRAHNYWAIDCFRPHLWRDERVMWWYAQNLLLYVRADTLIANPLLARGFADTNQNQLALVHPRRYLQLVSSSPK
jgi:SAM-dependent methyltransferase